MKRNDEKYDKIVCAIAKIIADRENFIFDLAHRSTRTRAMAAYRESADLVDAFDYTGISLDEFCVAWRSVEDYA